MSTSSRPRLLVFIVAYNAETTIESTLTRIPASLMNGYEVEVLVIDDSSDDATFDRGEAVRRAAALPFPLTVLFNPVNQGYGGNQKIGFHYAFEHGFDLVALLHGDGQYAPERLPDLLEPIAAGRADVVFGSRMLHKGDARRGGMPLYKYAGNRILSRIQNRLLRASLSEFHSGYRVYTTRSLRQVPFHLNTNVFHFDTEIIIQLLRAGARIAEVPIPTYYGSEICRVNGMKYAKDVVLACLAARAQDLSLFYERKFDCVPADTTNARYQSRLGFTSTHTMAIERVPPGTRVLDIGCADGHVGRALRDKGCHVIGIDAVPPADAAALDEFRPHDLDAGPLPADLAAIDCAVMLDVIEHLRSPERFVDDFLASAAGNPSIRLIATTGNIGFVVMRLMLLLGQFNYGRKGILDRTHTRLYTFRTFRRLFEESGFEVLEARGIPAPYPLAVGRGWLGRALLALNQALIRVSRTLFSYQILVVARPKPGLTFLLESARLRPASARPRAAN